jgi:hypothetical protein
MPRKLQLSAEERERRSLAMRELNARGRTGRRRAKTDDERIRESLMHVVRTGTPRQRLDATRELAALDERSPDRRRPDFDGMSSSELDAHFTGLVLRVADHWASTRLLPQLRAEFAKRGLESVFDDALASDAA